MVFENTKMYIDGSWCDSASKNTMASVNPANGEVIAEFPRGNIADTERAIAAAKRSFYEDRTWRDMPVAERALMMRRVAEEMEARFAEFARTETLDMGKTLRESEADVDTVIHYFRYYADLIEKEADSQAAESFEKLGPLYDHLEGFGTIDNYVVYEPVGVCALITPWNYPLMMGAYKICPALAAGNSIVFKPSSSAVLSSVLLFEVFDKVGMPKGSVNLVLGAGGEMGDVLSSHPDVDMVTFTGSTEVGKGIMRNAVDSVKRVGLELGGKSPNIIFDDADLEGAVEWSMIGIFYNQGEVCSAGSRILVQEGIADRFIKRLAERAKAMTIGNPLENPDLGPMVSESQMNKVLEYIQIGLEEGATLACGGKRVMSEACKDGFYLEPTIFIDCRQHMRIVREEIFGPVVTVQVFKEEAEAVKMANDSPYGLAGAVFSADEKRAVRVAKELRAGSIFVNNYNSCSADAPWGGYKMSGIGRELGMFGLREYQETKQIAVNTTPGPVGWYEH